MKIADSPPDIILITKVIPKAQTNPFEEARIGFNVFLKFDQTFMILYPQVVMVLQSMYPTR